ncbi:MAG: hypothetical protein LBJ93_03535 [Clostridiales bacterium]|nr:hypothetical protein [Clostridiales bacterium]
MSEKLLPFRLLNYQDHLGIENNQFNQMIDAANQSFGDFFNCQLRNNKQYLEMEKFQSTVLKFPKMIFPEKLGPYFSKLTSYLKSLRETITLAEESLTRINKFIQLNQYMSDSIKNKNSNVRTQIEELIAKLKIGIPADIIIPIFSNQSNILKFMLETRVKEEDLANSIKAHIQITCAICNISLENIEMILEAFRDLKNTTRDEFVNKLLWFVSRQSFIYNTEFIFMKEITDIFKVQEKSLQATILYQEENERSCGNILYILHRFGAFPSVLQEMVSNMYNLKIEFPMFSKRMKEIRAQSSKTYVEKDKRIIEVTNILKLVLIAIFSKTNINITSNDENLARKILRISFNSPIEEIKIKSMPFVIELVRLAPHKTRIKDLAIRLIQSSTIYNNHNIESNLEDLVELINSTAAKQVVLVAEPNPELEQKVVLVAEQPPEINLHVTKQTEPKRQRKIKRKSESSLCKDSEILSLPTFERNVFYFFCTLQFPLEEIMYKPRIFELLYQFKTQSHIGRNNFKCLREKLFELKHNQDRVFFFKLLLDSEMFLILISYYRKNKGEKGAQTKSINYAESLKLEIEKSSDPKTMLRKNQVEVKIEDQL